MKVVVLAGGFGTRLSEETDVRPKPMVEIGGWPILWHIMNIYASYRFTDFIVACGYKGSYIKRYFRDFYSHNSDFTISLTTGNCEVLGRSTPDWRITLVDTGLSTMTGGRVLRLRKFIGDQTFMVTYGDGVADIDIGKLVEFHRSHGKMATVTAVRPPARFGSLAFSRDSIIEFGEKVSAEEAWINGGFFVFEPAVFDLIDGDEVALERETMERLTAMGELVGFRHTGFWQPMDTLREKHQLQELWDSGDAPWKRGR